MLHVQKQDKDVDISTSSNIYRTHVTSSFVVVKRTCRLVDKLRDEEGMCKILMK
jgi:hypothetical protein